MHFSLALSVQLFDCGINEAASRTRSRDRDRRATGKLSKCVRSNDDER